MYIDAKVENVLENGNVMLQASCESDCKSCKGGLFCKQKNSFFEAECKEIKCKKGDNVRVYLPKGKTIFSSVMLFIVPLLFMLVPLVLGGCKVISELLSAILSIACLLLSFGIIFLLNKKYKNSLMPIITEVYEH